jgi:hypothetical protein
VLHDPGMAGDERRMSIRALVRMLFGGSSG